MAVTSTDAVTGPYTGNGVTRGFPYTFDVVDPGDVSVQINGTTVAQNAYSVNVADRQVVFEVAPAAGSQIYVFSDPTFQQQIQFENGSRWLAGPVNEANDRSAIRDIALAARLDRTVVAPIGRDPIDYAREIIGTGPPGPAGGSDNTYTSVAALKASPVNRVSARLAGTQLDGNFSYSATAAYPADNVNVIASDISGFWVRVIEQDAQFVPLAGLALADTTPIRKLSGPGEQKRGPKRFVMNDTEAGNDGIAPLMLKAGDLAAFRSALGSGTAKVLFWGDSITEGLSQIGSPDSWPRLLAAEMQKRTSAALTFENFSISGRGIGEANSPTYVGAAPGSTNVNDFYHAPGSELSIPDLTLWPGGTTVGKSWREHVRDRAPDLLVISLGINNSADPNAFYATYKSLINNYVKTWAKVPSIVLVPPFQPTRLQEPYLSQQANIEANAHAVRGLADELNLSMVDHARQWIMLRDGLDQVRQRFRQYSSLSDYASWVIASGAKPATGASLVFSAAGVVLRPVEARDVRIRAKIAVSGSQVGRIWYRADPGTPTNAYKLQIERGVPQAVLYYGSTPLASAALPAASEYDVLITAHGGDHRVWIDAGDGNGFVRRIGGPGNWCIDVKSTKAGYAGYGGDAGVTVSQPYMQLGYDRQTGQGSMPEKLLLGAVDDFASDVYSVGGNAINHPSQIGHYHGCFAAWAGFLSWVQSASTMGGATIVSDSADATTGALVMNDVINLSVAGVTCGGNGIALSGSQADNTWGGSIKGYQIVNGSSAVVKLTKQTAGGGGGTTDLVTKTVTFPASGKWLVTVDGFASQRDTLIRHRIVMRAEVTA